MLCVIKSHQPLGSIKVIRDTYHIPLPHPLGNSLRQEKRPSKSVFHGNLDKEEGDLSGDGKSTGEVWGEVIPLAVDQMLYMRGWVDEWMDGRMDRRMDG